MNSLIFGMSDQNTNMATFLDASSFDEKFVIEPERDFIYNVHHVDNKYYVPILSGGYREMFEYARQHLIHPDDRAYENLMDPDVIASRFAESPTPGMVKAEFREKLVDGSYRWVQYLGIIGLENGVPEGQIFFYVFDIQDQKDRMAGAASIERYCQKRDGVTGLRTRENFIHDALILAQEAKGPWCCLALDIQNFKLFNLWLGHDQGTYLLCRIGEYQQSIEKETDAVAAYFGCDNFALFMRHQEDLIQRIHDDVREIVSSLSNTAGLLPAIGVCVLDEGEHPKLDIYDRARLMVADEKMDKRIENIQNFVPADEHPGATILELIKTADHEMFRAKSRHYQKKGIDRRIQQAAYNALCDSYAKILKVNLAEDRFEVIRAEDSELDSARGYNDRFSWWIADFAQKNQVYPDDIPAYLEDLDIVKIKRFFAEGGTRFSARHRRLYNGEFSLMHLEIMPAPDYTHDNQSVFFVRKGA